MPALPPHVLGVYVGKFAVYRVSAALLHPSNKEKKVGAFILESNLSSPFPSPPLSLAGQQRRAQRAAGSGPVSAPLITPAAWSALTRPISEGRAYISVLGVGVSGRVI